MVEGGGDEKIADPILEKSIIPALWSLSPLRKVEELGFKVIFALKVSIIDILKFEIPDTFVFVDVDMMGGFKADEDGLRFLKDFNVKGIITVKPKVVNIAKKMGFSTVLRVFAVDSRAVEKGIQQFESALSDYLEILPGMMAPKFMDRFKLHTKMNPPKIIAAGLIDRKDEAEYLFSKKVHAISTSDEKMWNWFAKCKKL